MDMEIDESVIPSMAVYFTHNDDMLGRFIRFFTGGLKAISDPLYVNHAGLFTRDNGYLFGTEETPGGLDEISLSEYSKPSATIVHVYYWKAWDSPEILDSATKLLDKTRSESGPSAKYNYWALLSELPLIGRFFKWAWRQPEMICSQSVAWVHIQHGCTWLGTDELSPNELLAKFKWASENITDPLQKVERIVGYYK